jgi:hypothetical protein
MPNSSIQSQKLGHATESNVLKLAQNTIDDETSGIVQTADSTPPVPDLLSWMSDFVLPVAIND